MPTAAEVSPASDAAPTTLNRLRRGQSGIVLAINHAAATVRQKYLARGIVPGARLEVLQGGDPIVVAVDDGRWAIDGDEAAHIEIALIDARSSGWWQRAVRSMRRRGAQP